MQYKKIFLNMEAANQTPRIYKWLRRKRKQRAEKLMLLNYGVGEDSWESLGLQGDPTSPS